eukprot:6327613-Pyramimonas_sp.AAC.1
MPWLPTRGKKRVLQPRADVARGENEAAPDAWWSSAKSAERPTSRSVAPCPYWDTGVRCDTEFAR